MKITDITPSKEHSGEPIRLAAYCRVSSNSDDQLHSFAAQIRYYRDYENRHPEYRLVDIYADEGLTGTCIDKRDELNRMLRDCQRGLIDRVITKSVSRLARNTVDILNMVRMLKSIGVGIYFEEQRLDSGTMNLEMFLTLPGMAAQQESMTISQNLRWSNRRRMASGDYKISRPPFGYIIVNDQLEVFEPEAEIVRRIFDMYLSGIGKMSIARSLNAEGIPSHNSKGKWHHIVVEYILNNERYMGDAVFQKRYNTEAVPYREIRNDGDLPKYYVEDSNPPIISKEKWEAAHRLMVEKSGQAVRHDEDDTFAKIIKCGECGWVFFKRVYKDWTSWASKCSNSDVHSCAQKRVTEEAVRDAFIRLVLKLKKHIQEIIDPSLSSQLAVINRLYNDGYLKQDEYTVRSVALNDKLTCLRSEKRKKKKEEDDELDRLRELRSLLIAADDEWAFDDTLFRQIVVEIIVVSNAELRFKLIGGLEFTEYIEERERCKSV